MIERKCKCGKSKKTFLKLRPDQISDGDWKCSKCDEVEIKENLFIKPPKECCGECKTGYTSLKVVEVDGAEMTNIIFPIEASSETPPVVEKEIAKPKKRKTRKTKK
jgi:hypothetical protein